MPEAESDRNTLAGSPEHTRRVFLMRCDVAEHVAVIRKNIAEAYALIAKVDAILARDKWSQIG
jgi:hypothetical protein